MNNGTVGIVTCLKGLSIYGMYIEKIAQFKGYLLRGAYLELNIKFLIFPRTCRYTAVSLFKSFSDMMKRSWQAAEGRRRIL